MFIQGKTLAMALSALTFLSHAIPANAAGLGRPARGINHARSLKPAANKGAFEKRDAGISAQDVAALQNEYTAFHGWVNTWFTTALEEDAATAVAQLKQEFQAYDSWINAWFGSALSSGTGSDPSATAPSQLSTAPLPQSTSIAPSPDLSSPVGPSRSFISVAPYPTASLSQGSVGGPSGAGSPSQGFPSGSAAYSYMPSGTAPSGTAPLGTGSVSISSINPGGPIIPGPSSSGSISSAASASAAPSSSPGSGSFNAKAKDNVAVYYGQTAATSQVKLTDLCADASTNIVIISFLTTFAGPGGYPTVNFGAACSGSASPAMTAKGATGLLSCPDLGTQIKTCQAAGKKVMLSLGGADASSAFTSDSQATQFATQLWNLFGAGTGEDAGLRPFGAGVTVDGFDIDNENKQPAHYTTFVSALRSTFKADSSKSYYISAAPQCPTPDASIPLDAMKQMDFVWVQFYNNGNCNVGQSGFAASFKTWSEQLGSGTMLYMGAPACGGTACAGSGYVPPAQMGDVVKSAITSGATNMGGVMLWDGAEGYVNKDGGSSNYMGVVKAALG